MFVSHGTRDTWIARQMARCIGDVGAETFVDAYDIEGGDSFEVAIKAALLGCDELVALITPLAVRRAWLHTEMGAAWLQGKRVSAILHGVTLRELEHGDGGAGLVANRHARDLNDFDHYLRELKARCEHGG